MPKKVQATQTGFFDGMRKRKGDVFVIGDKIKVGNWMQVLKDVPEEAARSVPDEKDELIIEAKGLAIIGVARTWGIDKLKEAIEKAKVLKEQQE